MTLDSCSHKQYCRFLHEQQTNSLQRNTRMSNPQTCQAIISINQSIIIIIIIINHLLK
jgi:hypothetical protein